MKLGNFNHPPTNLVGLTCWSAWTRGSASLPGSGAGEQVRKEQRAFHEPQGRNAAFMRQSQPPTPLLPAKAGVPLARVHGPDALPNFWDWKLSMNRCSPKAVARTRGSVLVIVMLISFGLISI